MHNHKNHNDKRQTDAMQNIETQQRTLPHKAPAQQRETRVWDGRDKIDITNT